MKKKVILVILGGIFFGYLFGLIFFKNYKGFDYLESDGNIYYLQYGVYTTLESANNNTSNLNEVYYIKELDNKYYVYLGVTADYDKALKLKDIYEKNNIHIYIRSDYVENSETLDKLKEYDELLQEDNINAVMQEIFQDSNLNL